MDLFSRKIIAWTLSETLEAEHVANTVRKAMRQRNGDPTKFCVKPNKALPIRQDLGQGKIRKEVFLLWKKHQRNY